MNDDLLIIASTEGRNVAVRKLLREGKVDIASENYGALRNSAHNQHIEVFRTLLKHVARKGLLPPPDVLCDIRSTLINSGHLRLLMSTTTNQYEARILDAGYDLPTTLDGTSPYAYAIVVLMIMLLGLLVQFIPYPA